MKTNNNNHNVEFSLVYWLEHYCTHDNNNNNNNNNNNDNNNLNNNKILLTTMLTVKILFTINSLEKKEKLFIQNTIYNSCRFKKHLI